MAMKDEFREYAGVYAAENIKRSGLGLEADLVFISECGSTKIGTIEYSGYGEQYSVKDITDEDYMLLKVNAKSKHPKFADAPYDYCTPCFVEHLVNHTEAGLL